MKKLILLLVLIIALSNITIAATIHGEIYDISLNKINDVKVEIDTAPKQTIISKDGSYIFNVPLGDYTVKAVQYKNNEIEAYTTETINIESEGDFTVDLILFPYLSVDDEIIDDIDLSDDYFKTTNYILYIIIVIIIIIIVFFIWNRSKFKKITGKIEKKLITGKDSKDIKQIIEILKKENGRMTQRDLRKHFNLSEAKISLMLTELEHKGLIKRIKKGRGNIIILQ